MKEKFKKIVLNEKVIFIFLIFAAYKDLFNSYFEADEWFHFTYYLPLTQKPDGFFTALVSTILNTGPLSGGQHVIPIASTIYYLNTRLFGLNYVPYAFMTLFFHSLNSILVFLLLKTLLSQSKENVKNVFAALGAIFFALPSIAIHAITGAAPFYGQNVLSVTFFLLCLLFFKLAFIRKKGKLIYFSIIFLFFALFSKETTAFLFILLPIMAIIEKRFLRAGRQIFSLKFLTKLYIISLIIYSFFRFIVPQASLINNLGNKLADNYISSARQNTDTKTIVSQDRSIHKNIYGEVVFRAITYPLKMTSELYFPRETILSFMRVLTPIIYPLPSNVSGQEETIKSQNYQFFMNGPGNDLIIYILSVVILMIVISEAKQFLSDKKVDEYKTLITGLAIVVLGALPLALIVLSFPRWGYDTYFDSRHYYLPSVGGAILFPFLLFSIARFASNLIRRISPFYIPHFLITGIIFIFWFINNMTSFQTYLHTIVDITGKPRKEIVTQIKNILPVLPKKAVFYVETDGLGGYGPLLPFQTSVAQAFTVVYYDKNPLPDSFFEKPLFDGKSEGYLYSEGRGFGYYTSKRKLSEDLLAGRFKTSDTYAFYYDSQNVKISDITSKMRLEMKDYLKQAKANSNWKKFSSLSGNFSFFYPPQTFVNEIKDGEYSLYNPNFRAVIKVFNVSLGFDINEYSKIKSQEILDVASSKKVSYDRFHYNDALVIVKPEASEYLIKLNDKLIYLTSPSLNDPTVEKILGSVDVFK